MSDIIESRQNSIYRMKLQCYVGPRKVTRLSLVLRRVMDVYLRHSPHLMVGATELEKQGQALPQPMFLLVVSNQAPVPLGLVNTADLGTISFTLRTYTIGLLFLSQSIQAVPRRHWEHQSRTFSIRTMINYVCFLRFAVHNSSSSPGSSDPNGETTQFLIICALREGRRFGIKLFMEKTFTWALSSRDSTIRSKALSRMVFREIDTALNF